MSQRRNWSDRHELHGRSLIAGKWIDGVGDVVVRDNPATGEPLSTVTPLDAVQAGAAVDAARSSCTAWFRMPFHGRADVLLRAADAMLAREADLAELCTLEQGKPLHESITEVRRGARILRFFAAEADRASGELYHSPRADEHTRVFHVPRGVVVLVTPWNFPVAIPIWKLAPALVHGNTVIWKPAGIVPALSTALARILHEAGLPDGVLNVVHANPDVAEGLVSSSAVDAVSFTGSTAVGTRIIQAAAANRTPVQAEMGGKNVTIVMADADLGLVVDALIEGSMGSTGQRCTATERLLVDRRVGDELLDRVAERTRALVVGDGMEPGTDVGPVATAAAKRAIEDAFARAVAEGATSVAVAPVDAVGEGNFVAPTVFEIADTAAPIWTDEVFGPVIAARRFDGFDEAVALANATPYGLTAAVFTDSHAVVERAAVDIDVGVLHINSATIGADPHVPFGGIGASGYGPKEQGAVARDFYTDSRTVYEKWVNRV